MFGASWHECHDLRSKNRTTIDTKQWYCNRNCYRILSINFLQSLEGLQHVCWFLSSTSLFVDNYTRNSWNLKMNPHSSCHIQNQLLLPHKGTVSKNENISSSHIPNRFARAVATPSCYGHVDEPLWGAPFPWCQPLPGWACTVGEVSQMGLPSTPKNRSGWVAGCFPSQWYSGIFEHL